MNLIRTSTGLTALDHVLGGGLVAGSVILFAGTTGLGRTILSFQMLAGLGHRCLYASGEETRAHLEDKARRFGALIPQLSLLSGRNLASIFARAREVRAKTIVVDSIQTITCADVDGRHGSPAQIKACVSRLVHYAKTNDTAIWLIDHVTKRGDIAGPKTIKHAVDVMLKLGKGKRFEGRERILQCAHKNRFGPSNTVSYFKLTAKGFVAVAPT